MRYLKAVDWIGVVLAAARAVYKPAIDSGTALIAAILALGGLYLLGRGNVEKADSSQSQNVSGHGLGIQAGRDVKIGESGDRKRK